MNRKSIKNKIFKKYGLIIIFIALLILLIIILKFGNVPFVGKGYSVVQSEHITMTVNFPDTVYVDEEFTVTINLIISGISNGVLVAIVIPNESNINSVNPPDAMITDDMIMWTLSGGGYNLLINLTSNVNGSYELEAKYGTYDNEKNISEEKKIRVVFDVIEIPSAICGNNICETEETCSSCPNDCGQCCGNNVCDYGETCNSCSLDCGECPTAVCGNDVCETGESCSSCPSDCGTDPNDEGCFDVFCAPDECCEGGMCWRVDPCAGIECGLNEHPIQTGPGPGECECMPD